MILPKNKKVKNYSKYINKFADKKVFNLVFFIFLGI